jgi:tetratricopeptide (TPR) repeat protein
MCGKSATLACQHCRVTYYCGKEHQSVDWFGIHEKICQLLGALRTLRPTLGSEDERQRRNLTVQMSQHALIDLCKNEAQKHLVQGQYETAIPGALQSLRFSMEVYGSGRIELVPSYLLLAESNLGLKRFKVAEEFLLYANWSVLKNPACSNELKSQLYRNFGKLYASQGRYKDALRQLANDVYYSSLESGPEHIDTTGGYYYMADVFLQQQQVEQALALYDKVVDIWYKFLVKLRKRTDETISDYLSEAHIGEAAEMLRSILAYRVQYLGPQHIATGEVAYAIGILKHITGFQPQASKYYAQALQIYQISLGQENESTKAIKRALQEVQVPGDDGSADAAAAAAAAGGGAGGGGAGAGAPANILSITDELQKLSMQLEPVSAETVGDISLTF